MDDQSPVDFMEAVYKAHREHAKDFEDEQVALAFAAPEEAASIKRLKRCERNHRKITV